MRLHVKTKIGKNFVDVLLLGAERLASPLELDEQRAPTRNEHQPVRPPGVRLHVELQGAEPQLVEPVAGFCLDLGLQRPPGLAEPRLRARRHREPGEGQVLRRGVGSPVRPPLRQPALGLAVEAISNGRHPGPL
jgi:hypothetical protein